MPSKRPENTQSLHTHVDSSLMHRMSVFLEGVRNSGSPMTKRSLIETAVSEYIDRQSDSEKETPLSLVKAMQKDQTEIGTTLSRVAEAHLLFVIHFFKNHGPLPTSEEEDALKRANQDMREFMERAGEHLSSGNLYSSRLSSLDKRSAK